MWIITLSPSCGHLVTSRETSAPRLLTWTISMTRCAKRESFLVLSGQRKHNTWITTLTYIYHKPNFDKPHKESLLCGQRSVANIRWWSVLDSAYSGSWLKIILKVSVLVIGIFLKLIKVTKSPSLTNWKWLSPVRKAHDPLMGISGVKPWPGLTVNQLYPLLSPPYNLTDHIPQIAGSACGPGVVFMVNGRSTFSFLFTHSPSCSLKICHKNRSRG